jgi:hypothetical protein
VHAVYVKSKQCAYIRDTYQQRVVSIVAMLQISLTKHKERNPQQQRAEFRYVKVNARSKLGANSNDYLYAGAYYIQEYVDDLLMCQTMNVKKPSYSKNASRHAKPGGNIPTANIFLGSCLMQFNNVFLYHGSSRP